jgi:hypothetical protein
MTLLGKPPQRPDAGAAIRHQMSAEHAASSYLHPVRPPALPRRTERTAFED